MTNNEVITKALQKIGIVPAGESPTADDASDALSILNQMMYQWSVSDMDLHWAPQDTLSATCPIPDWAQMAVISSLAAHCTVDFRVPLSTELALEVSSAQNALKRTLINGKLESADMSHLWQGSSGTYNINTDS